MDIFHDTTNVRGIAPELDGQLRFRLAAVDAGGASRATSTSVTDAKVGQVVAATRDGMVSATERTTFEKGGNAEAIKSESDRLHAAVKGTVREKAGTATALYRVPAVDTEHTRQVKQLASGRKLEEIQKDIDQRTKDLALFPAGSAGRATMEKDLAALKASFDQRKQAEAGVVANIKDKRQLDATLELEKVDLQASLPKSAQNDYQELREKAQPYIDLFNRNKGDYYHGSVFLGFGEDWGDESHLTFDKMVGDLAKDPARLDRWLGEQDNDVNRAAVEALTSIVKDYSSAQGAVEQTSKRIDAINAEQGELRESIKRDMTALSKQTSDALAAGTDASADAPGSSDPSTQDDPAKPGDQNDGTKESTDPTPGATDDSPVPPGQPGGPDATPPSQELEAPAVTADDIVARHNGLGATYQVKAGDTLSSIASRYRDEYGIDVDWRAVYDANEGQIDDPNLIFPGQVFIVPAVDDRIAAEVDEAAAAAERARAAERVARGHRLATPY